VAVRSDMAMRPGGTEVADQVAYIRTADNRVAPEGPVASVPPDGLPAVVRTEEVRVTGSTRGVAAAGQAVAVLGSTRLAVVALTG